MSIVGTMLGQRTLVEQQYYLTRRFRPSADA